VFIVSGVQSKVCLTVKFCRFYIKCSMYPPCCWTTHSKICCYKNRLVFNCCFLDTKISQGSV